MGRRSICGCIRLSRDEAQTLLGLFDKIKEAIKNDKRETN